MSKLPTRGFGLNVELVYCSLRWEDPECQNNPQAKASTGLGYMSMLTFRPGTSREPFTQQASRPLRQPVQPVHFTCNLRVGLGLSEQRNPPFAAGFRSRLSACMCRPTNVTPRTCTETWQRLETAKSSAQRLANAPNKISSNCQKSPVGGNLYIELR